MKNYDFYTRFGHGALKKYVEDYWQRFQTKSPHPSSSRVSASEYQQRIALPKVGKHNHFYTVEVALV